MGSSESVDEVHASVAATVSEQSLSDDAPSEEVSDEEKENGTEKYLCVRQAQARAGVSMDSVKSCSIEVDEVVDVLQKVETEDSEFGITVTRLQTTRGWVSEKTAAGNLLFRPAKADAVANAALRRAATLRRRAAAYDSDDEDPFSDNKDGGCASCCCSFLRNILLLVVALVLANFHYQLVDMSDLLMSAWYRASATSRAGLMQSALASPPPEIPETTDPLFGADVFYPGVGRLGVTMHGDT